MARRHPRRSSPACSPTNYARGGARAAPSDRRRRAGSGASTPGSRSSPPATRGSRRCSASTRHRRRCCSCAAIWACSTPAGSGIVGTRNATLAGRETAAALRLRPRRGGVAVVSGLAKGIDGAAHRGALAAGEMQGRTPGGRRRQRSRSAVPEAERRAVERGVRPRRAHLRVATGHPARRLPVPAAQPDPRRARARCWSWSRVANGAAA